MALYNKSNEMRFLEFYSDNIVCVFRILLYKQFIVYYYYY